MATIAEALALAVRYHQAGNLDKAEQLYLQILRADANNADAWCFLGAVHQARGQFAQAETHFRRAIQLAPAHPSARNFLGTMLAQQARLDEAGECLAEMLHLQPTDAETHHNLALVRIQQGRLDDALIHQRRVVELQPASAEALNNLGKTLQQRGLVNEAIAQYRQALRLDGNFASAHSNLGDALLSQDKPQEAAAQCRQALRLRPEFAEAHNNLANALRNLGQAEEAMAHFRQALALKPDFPEAHNNLAIELQGQGKLDEAEGHLREALRLRPTATDALNNLGGVLQLQGRLTEALDSYREVLRLSPNDSGAYSNLLLSANYDPDIDADTLFAEHREWGRRFGQVAGSGPAPGHDRNPTRRLRVGYVSPDLNWHPVAHFLQPILANHDLNQVEAICYAEGAGHDDMTTRLRSLARGWRSIHGLSDAQAADLIRADRIDILVDLAGHTAKNRLRVFAYKPAPVQVTYLGYPNTTGLTAIDYCLTDAIVDPPDEPARFTEELVRLPHGFCSYLPPAAPQTGPSPAVQNGYVTFASLHNLPKLNAGVFDVWSLILRRADGQVTSLSPHIAGQGQGQDTPAIHRARH